MILSENIAALKKYFPVTLEFMNDPQRTFANEEIQVINSRNGLPTIQVVGEQRTLFLHSKYNPLEEADTYVDSFGEEITAPHIFFYGVGLGYHIEAFMRKHPRHSFSIYEPNLAVFHAYLSHRRLEELPLQKLKNIYVEDSADSTAFYINHFVNSVKDETLMVVHPSYNRIFEQKTESFHQMFKKGIASKRQSLAVNASYQQRWTFNSLMNFPTVLKTTNVIKNLKPYFEGKMALLVAAGPSLQDEFENLRKIKDEGLAYIFAVGSANKALISQGIMPDAICSYDPTVLNQRVFQDIVDQDISDIPLFFGSSVGFEVLRSYPGTKLHMIINQDTIAPYYLEGQLTADEILSDAPSIAVVTLEMLKNLGCAAVALVGQNFGYRNNRIYSEGIVYKDVPFELSEEAKAKLIWVEGNGVETVATDSGHNAARNQMEGYIANYSSLEVLNTTKGGAKIAGAAFKSLDEIMSERLRERVVAADWLQESKGQYDSSLVLEQAQLMTKFNREFQYSLEALIKVFKKMESHIKAKSERELEATFLKFDKKIKKLTSNKFYEVFILPMVRVQLEILQKSTEDIRGIANLVERGQKAMDAYGRYVFECRECWYLIEGAFNSLQRELLNPGSVQD